MLPYSNFRCKRIHGTNLMGRFDTLRLAHHKFNGRFDTLRLAHNKLNGRFFILSNFDTLRLAHNQLNGRFDTLQLAHNKFNGRFITLRLAHINLMNVLILFDGTQQTYWTFCYSSNGTQQS